MLRFLGRDTWNLVRFGRSAPKACELLHVPTSQILGLSYQYKKFLGSREQSAYVTNDWLVEDKLLVNLDTLPKIRCCLLHWREGLSWDEAEAFNLKEYRRFEKRKIRKRLNNLDAVFDRVQKDNTLIPQSRLNKKHFREYDGIRVNIDPQGRPIFVDGGTHRLAMAIALDLPMVPAMLGLIHRDGIAHLRRFRISNRPSVV